MGHLVNTRPHHQPRSRQAPTGLTSDLRGRIALQAGHIVIGSNNFRSPNRNAEFNGRNFVSHRAQIIRYLKRDFRCLRYKRRSSRDLARTRYLQRCLRRTGSDVAHVTCVYLLLAAGLSVLHLTRTVRRRHVIAADSLVSGTFRRRPQITAVRRALHEPGGRRGSARRRIWRVRS
jgi:hypothetical protein